MRYQGSLKIQKILHTPKRIAEYAPLYAADTDGIRTIKEKWLQESQEHLYLNSENRFFDYDELALLCLVIGDAQQIALNDTKMCKKYLYQSSVYKSYACQYFKTQSPDTKEKFSYKVNLGALVYFEAAVIADADETARLIGDQLLYADQSDMPHNIEKMERILIHLFHGEDQKAKENCDLISKQERAKWKNTYGKLDLFEALLEGNNQKFYDLFIASLRGNRRSPYLEHFLDFFHIAIGKIAVKRGFELPVDTSDCPQCLLQPEICDYSSVKILEPIERLPWK